jgi:hypothetical protein
MSSRTSPKVVALLGDPLLKPDTVLGFGRTETTAMRDAECKVIEAQALSAVSVTLRAQNTLQAAFVRASGLERASCNQ